MNQVPNDKLDLAVYLYRAIEHRQVIGRTVSGVLPESVDLDAAIGALDANQMSGLHEAGSRKIEFKLPSSHNGFFALSLAELIENPERRRQVLNRFYLADIDFSFPATEIPAVVAQYVACAKFFTLLSKLADYQHNNGSDHVLVILQTKKIEITSSYSVSDLTELNGLEGFASEFIETKTHSSQKAAIIKMAIAEMVDKAAQPVPLSFLLSRFQFFVDKVRRGYDLYVSEFSFEKIRRAVEKEKFEFLVKLGKTFSDIQNQLLAVPVALILAGGQMKYENQWTLTNLLIWSGCFVFSVFMAMLIRNQRNSLDSVREEINQQWRQIKLEHSAVAEQFQDAYDFLLRRHQQQSTLIFIVEVIVSFALLAATCLLIWASMNFEAAVTQLNLLCEVLLLALFIYMLANSTVSDQPQ